MSSSPPKVLRGLLEQASGAGLRIHTAKTQLILPRRFDLDPSRACFRRWGSKIRKFKLSDDGKYFGIISGIGHRGLYWRGPAPTLTKRREAFTFSLWAYRSARTWKRITHTASQCARASRMNFPPSAHISKVEAEPISWLTCGPNNAIAHIMMHHLTTLGFAGEVRRLSVHCKAAAYRARCKCAAFDRNRRKLAETLKRDDWVAANRWQHLFNISILGHLES
eukprot:8588250-Pyramimonas_sp.AAC.1